MNLHELSELLGKSTEVLRVETLDAYSSASDGDMVTRYFAGVPKPDTAEKAPWLDRLRAARDDGHPWRRLRLVPRPVPAYLRYAAEWGYVDNVRAGEDVRVLDQDHAPDEFGKLRSAGDFYVVDGDVIKMKYTSDGALEHAYRSSMPGRLSMEAYEVYAWAVPFDDWWSTNVDLHRDLVDH